MFCRKGQETIQTSVSEDAEVRAGRKEEDKEDMKRRQKGIRITVTHYQFSVLFIVISDRKKAEQL